MNDHSKYPHPYELENAANMEASLDNMRAFRSRWHAIMADLDDAESVKIAQEGDMLFKRHQKAFQVLLERSIAGLRPRLIDHYAAHCIWRESHDFEAKLEDFHRNR